MFKVKGQGQTQFKGQFFRQEDMSRFALPLLFWLEECHRYTSPALRPMGNMQESFLKKG